MLSKLRFVEPGDHSPYQDSLLNFVTYNKHIKNPSTGLNILATIAKRHVNDTLMYSESISAIDLDDVGSADVIFFSINTFNATRGYQLADELRQRSRAVLVFGGMHASLNWTEAIAHCDFVLTGDGDESIVDLLRALDRNEEPEFPGLVKRRQGRVVYTGPRAQPEEIDTIPDRSLIVGYERLARRYDTLWPQVHASRGCPHACDYCAVIAHFGRKIRKRSPANVVEDIRQAVAFHRRRFIPRLNTVVWITDDNFAHDRDWAISVLKAIIASGIRARYSVQARYEIGFDDELLELMREAGFVEVALGIEFLDDRAFETYRKHSKREEIVRAIANIRRHGVGVRGLFIVGGEWDAPGVGRRIADFVIENGIHGALVQSMFFTPGTPVYERSKSALLHQNWEKYDGTVVHWPQQMHPAQLQREIIEASARIYSVGRLVRALLRAPGILKVLFIGEFLWQRSLRKELRRELPYLESLGERPATTGALPAAPAGPGLAA
ncbi:MAG: radical SAM protein [Myxococcales bacterium]